jgi:hypothetical protein
MIANTEFILPILGTLLGVAALGWNIMEASQKAIGYLIPKLECSYEFIRNEPYIVSKTKVENTSRKRIDLANAFLLIVEQPISFDEGIRLVNRKLNENNFIEERFLTEPINAQLREVSRSLKERGLLFLEEHDFIVKSLPYYFETHIGAGSYAQMSTTHIQKIKHFGVYSVYFAVIGKGWVSHFDPSKARMVHDEVVAK